MLAGFLVSRDLPSRRGWRRGRQNKKRGTEARSPVGWWRYECAISSV